MHDHRSRHVAIQGPMRPMEGSRSVHSGAAATCGCAVATGGSKRLHLAPAARFRNSLRIPGSSPCEAGSVRGTLPGSAPSAGARRPADGAV